ncbi:MAG: hypothetical protein Kow00120_01310 [Anaerolineae bacterium]
MKESLLAGLKSANAKARLNAARVLGMVEEVGVLDAVRAGYKDETDPEVRRALAWAGQRLYAGQQAGYTTVDEIFRRFGIDREIAALEDEEEAKLLRKLQDDFDMDMIRRRADAGKTAAAVTAAGILMGGTIMGALQPGAGAAGSNLGPAREQITSQRTPAAMPSNADISVWLKRLNDEAAPDVRANAARELQTLNNPAALPHLAHRFLTDPAPAVREAAERAGKALYLGAVYWQMERDGSLEAEYQRRVAAAGKLRQARPAAQGDAPPASAPPPTQKQDINAILRQAEANRRRRKR